MAAREVLPLRQFLQSQTLSPIEPSQAVRGSCFPVSCGCPIWNATACEGIQKILRVFAAPKKSASRSGQFSMSVTAFHEKAGRSQVISFVFCWTRFFSCRVATVATLPSALFVERFVRSVPVGCSRFSRCCHLIVDLSSIFDGSGPGHRRSHRNSALGFCVFLPKNVLTLCCRRHRYLVAVAQRFVRFSAHPQTMQQNR